MTSLGAFSFGAVTASKPGEETKAPAPSTDSKPGGFSFGPAPAPGAKAPAPSAG